MISDAIRAVSTGSSPKSNPASGFSYDEYIGQATDPKAPKGMQRNAQLTTSRSPWYEAAGRVALDRAMTLSERPYEAYSGQRVAGLSQNERLASGLARSSSEQYRPMVSRLQSGFSGDNISKYMNPYTDKVLGARLRTIGNEYGRQSGALAKNAAASDAFRTGRSDLQRARLDLSRMRAVDEATNQANADAYESAKNAYFQQGQQDLSSIGTLSSASSQEISNLSGTGAAERSIDQANADFNYGQFLERRDWDVNNLNNLIAAIQGVDSTAGKTETQYGKKPKKSTWGSIMGMAGTALGAVFGGPAGAQIGGALGGAVGGAIDG